ncbi:MAG: DNA replication/repair protein RecF [Candidatus Nephthysia bennettiae]|uniref:DNA replication and repair protein RecF n=1 Tax=Candidatus Nephthysia bennettiae TaxID=3127016 RepID=A0A934K6J3_9BACT|nr:DNA replication/repair protein RecF [Candidatus Dormibacteraeota bacterium]MBJ7612340.1 DNA replication/repair protein RecF [Candidatus Dormibacteraeota bacterium]PZR85549.1 MAG: DNA replication/repair protein RecF [Candidatus Dormibacteraeota bacterium]
MRLLGLELRNYRNYSRLDLEPGPWLNLFLGANGQGKTNLLESVAMLALSSSPRARRDSELVGPLAPEARIVAMVESGSRRSEVRISILLDGERARRRIEVDGQPRRAVDLPGLFRVTLFWPDDLNLVKSGPEHRRRLLNQLLVQVEPGYARALSRYTRVVEQRNSLLKQVAMGEQPPSALEVWDLELARVGGQIAQARSRAMEALTAGAASAHAAISGGEQLELEYLGPPEDLLGAVENSRAEDLRRGSTSVGPHRDDILIRLAGRDARGFASQGQQRTAVVSVKLAEAELVGQMTGERPVLLLDDVLSELDGERRKALLESLSEPGQVVITSVEAEPFPTSVIGRSLVRCIESGQVKGCG